MACFLVPAAEAVATSIAKIEADKKETAKKTEQETKIPFSTKLSWLRNMLWGGAVTGAVAAIGSKYGRTETGEDRKPSADAVRSFLKQFEEEFGTIYCKELQKAYVKEHKLKSPGMYRACTVFVEKAVELAKEMIEEKQ